MTSLEEFKNAMGSASENYSDEQLLEILNLQEQLADLLFDCWVDRDNKV